jgi:hypothetical protein
MAHIAVKDVVIWVKHIHGGDAVRRQVLGLRGGETIDLIVDGFRGRWRKMDDGRDGRPTHGIRPIGRTEDFWRELYSSKRGDLVELDLAGADAQRQPSIPFRTAARSALLQGLEGYRSDGSPVTRDDAHDRELDRDEAC